MRSVGRRRRLERRIGGLQRVLRERVQDVGEQQFLMLLFVMEAEFDQRRDFGLVGVRRDEGAHRFIDMGAVFGDLGGADGRVSSPRAGRGWRGPTAS